MIPIENLMRIKCITHTYHPIHARVYKDIQFEHTRYGRLSIRPLKVGFSKIVFENNFNIFENSTKMKNNTTNFMIIL